VLSAAFLHGLWAQRREALAWIVVGIATVTAIEVIKDLVASAAFYPLLAWVLTRRRARLFPVALSLAAVLVLLVSVGRLYLGLHWPTDVLGGWMIGGTESALAIGWLRRGAPGDVSREERAGA
jgi:uncharacterized membrane protein